MKYENRKAIIDCGTNTFHLLIVDTNIDGTYSVIHREKQPVKIGAGGIEKNIITDSAIERAITTLQNFRTTIDINNVPLSNVKATATSAFRNAQNGLIVTKLIDQVTGIKIQIINGETEANLIYNGVKKAVNLTKENSLIMDIGGGSVEFILCNSDGIKWLKSYEIGGQRLLENFHLTDPINQVEITKLTKYLNDQLNDLATECEELNPTQLIGASGTFDTFSAIYSTRFDDHFDENKTLSFNIPIQNTIEIIDDIIKKNKKERLTIPGMIPMRVDMIVVASILVKKIILMLSFTKITTTTYALKEGILFSPDLLA